MKLDVMVSGIATNGNGISSTRNAVVLDNVKENSYLAMLGNDIY